MATEKTKFDDWLKDNLWRDLIFRSVTWISVASLASYLSLSVDAVTANQYLKNQTNTVVKLSNIVGTIAILLGLIAMIFKDMEAVSPGIWGKETLLGGWIGGFLRRLAGDLTLWTLGALVTVLFSITVYGLLASGTSWRDWAIFSFSYLLIAILCIFVAGLNVLVRRAETFLPEMFSNSYVVLCCYVATIIATVYFSRILNLP